MPVVLTLPPSLGPIQAEARADIMAEWLTRRLGQSFDVQVAPSYDALRQCIETGATDVAWVPPSVCANIEHLDLTVYKAVRHGRSEYVSAIVTRTQDGTTLEDLRGQRAAWVDPMSLAGYQLPVAHLRRHGIDPERDLGGQDFVGAYGAALRLVLAHKADVAAMYCTEASPDALERRLHELLGSASALLQPLAFTHAVPTDAVVILGHARAHGLDLPRFRATFDGSEGYTFFLSLLEADRLVPAVGGEYAVLRA